MEGGGGEAATQVGWLHCSSPDLGLILSPAIRSVQKGRFRAIVAFNRQLRCHDPTGSPCSTVGAWGGAYRAARSKARPRPSANANWFANYRRLERLPAKGIGVLLGVRLGSLRYRAAVPEVGHPTPPIEWVAPFAKAKASAPPPIETDSFLTWILVIIP